MPLKTRPDVDVLAEIGLIGRLATVGLERVLPQGLSAAGFDVLTQLAHAADMASSPLALAEALGVGKSAMTHTLQRLQAEGLISVRDDPADGRRKIVAMTAVGGAAHRVALIAARPRLEDLRRRFGDNAFEAALPFLRRLRAALAEQA